MNETLVGTYPGDIFVLRRVKFTIILLLQIPAIALSLLIFIFFTKHRSLRKALQNHGLIILLIVNFIELLSDIPLGLQFYLRDYVTPATPAYCTWWTFIGLTMSTTSAYLVATIAIQRHMFIFSQHLLRIRWMRVILHNFPLAVSVAYPMLFYLFAIVLYPCDGSQWDYTSRLCGFADCYLLFDKWLGTFDLSINAYTPMVIDILANTILIARIFRQKRRAQRALRWQQQRRMIVQLFCLSTLFLIGWTPSVVVQMINVLHDPFFFYQIQQNYFLDLMYVVYLFLPWMYLGFFPELPKWIMQRCRCRQAPNAVPTAQARDAVRPPAAALVEARV